MGKRTEGFFEGWGVPLLIAVGTFLLQLLIYVVLISLFGVVMAGREALVQEWAANIRAGHMPTLVAVVGAVLVLVMGLWLFALWFTQTVTAGDASGRRRVRTQRIFAVLWLALLFVSNKDRLLQSETGDLSPWINLNTIFLFLMLTGKLRLPQRRRAAGVPQAKKK